MSEDDFTPIRCRSCGGRYQIGDSTCKWCTLGLQTPTQLGAWMRRQSGQRPAVRSSSATTFDPHRALVLERLCKSWDKVPEMKFGELITDALAYMHMAPSTLGRLDDERLAEIVEHYLMYGGSKPPEG